MKKQLILFLFILVGCGQSTLSPSLPENAQTQKNAEDNAPVSDVPIKSHGPENGVNVGNGNKPLRQYLSPYFFQLSYSDALTKVESADGKEVRFENSSIVNKSDEVSKITFKVLQPGKDYTRFHSSSEVNEHLSGLEAYAKEQVPGVVFTPITLQNTVGWYFESRKGSLLIGTYFILMKNLNLIRADVVAFSEGRGIELVATIARTFSVDTTPPELQGFETVGSYKAGEVGKIRFKAIDAGSGLDLVSNNGWSVTLSEYKPGNPDHMIYLSQKYVELGNDWYEVSFSLSEYMPAGEYKLNYVSLRDKADNRRVLHPNQNGKYGYYDTNSKMIELNVPVLKINITN